MHTSIIDFFTGFTVYLQDAGFPVSESELARLIRSISETDLDITDEQELLPAITVCLAKTREQTEIIKTLFSEYIQSILSPELRKEQENEKKKKKEALNNSKRDKEEEIQKLSKEKDRIEQEVLASHKEKNVPLSKKLEKQFNKSGSGKLSQADKELFEQVKRGENVSEKQMEHLADALMKEAEKNLFAGRMEEAQTNIDASKYLRQKAAAREKKANSLKYEIRSAQADTIKKIEALKKQIEKEEQQYQAACNEINRKLNELDRNAKNQKGALQVKESSVLHRVEFLGGGSVQALDPEFVKASEKTFKSLSVREKTMIRNYLRENLLAFKTRMTRNIMNQRRLSMDIENTLREAVRTCGQPMNLVYKLPKRSKADLILILDVSGSCKAASEMMLTFIGILKEIFPRGCSAFAFVNRLYDISKVYDTANVDESIDEVLNMIPRAGQYSNYERPLREMWEDHRNKITKDSCVIFIGDARNNKNDAGRDYIRNICRKAKCAYWLNTDVREKWDQGDSIASVYGKYAKMYETTNVKELLGFISEMR